MLIEEIEICVYLWCFVVGSFSFRSQDLKIKRYLALCPSKMFSKSGTKEFLKTRIGMKKDLVVQ